MYSSSGSGSSVCTTDAATGTGVGPRGCSECIVWLFMVLQLSSQQSQSLKNVRTHVILYWTTTLDKHSV
jgi:hypothetical protein